MLELITPLDLPSLPKIFRLTSIKSEVIDHKRTENTATLFHEKAAIKVRWTASHPDSRLLPGLLVSPRWMMRHDTQRGELQISRLVLIERPEAMENLFDLVPSGWVRDRTLVRQAADLIETLPRNHRHLLNAIFWEGGRFHRFCTGPSSMNGHHNGDNGNLRHAIEVAAMMREGCGTRSFTTTPLGILAAFLHDAGKADEYRLDQRGSWKLSDRGKLLGHKVTLIEWIAAAMAKHRVVLPSSHYMALLHCMTASQNAPEWLGIRKPAMLEALMLSDMDRLSGVGDLMGRCAANDGWGRYHPHLKVVPYSIA